MFLEVGFFECFAMVAVQMKRVYTSVYTRGVATIEATEATASGKILILGNVWLSGISTELIKKNYKLY